MTLHKKIWNWYKSLPWWGQILGVVVLVLVALLSILSLFNKRTPTNIELLEELDEQHKEQVDTQLETLSIDAKKKQEDIAKKKQELQDVISSAIVMDQQTFKDYERINAAKTMDELDELQKKLGI